MIRTLVVMSAVLGLVLAVGCSSNDTSTKSCTQAETESCDKDLDTCISNGGTQDDCTKKQCTCLKGCGNTGGQC